MASTPPAHWQRALTLLDVALAMAPAPREQWLAETAAREPDIAPLLRKLLQSHDRVETHDILATLPKVLKPPRQADGAAAGQQVGPFELIEALGRGGMGSVWRARYADGRLKRDVAVKLPASTEDALTLATLRERFARERDFLAQLQHPHIARLYDAGVSASGQPYLAMEYVAGKAIDAYCDEQRLTVKARLSLFLQVLDAVAYAHQQLVLHRDLKPGNVLVDGQQQVRLLDFGVARLLPTEGVAPAAADSDLTERAGAAFTLSYAAPEQIGRGALSTATDVYALGVMLYRLLTGLSPYQPLRDTRGSLEDAVLVSVPALASGRSFSDEALQARQTTAAGLRKALVNDLDVILAKALKKEPGERYATAEALASDLRRHVAQQPISASGDGWGYRARLFVARNRGVVVGTGLAVSALLTTTGVAVWQSHLSAVNAAKAAKEAASARTARDFFANIIGQADPEKNKNITPIDRRILDQMVATAERDFAGAPETLAMVLKNAGDIYLRLGMPDLVLQVQKRRMALLERDSLGSPAEVALAKVALGKALAEAESAQDRAQALPVLREAHKLALNAQLSQEVIVEAMCAIANELSEQSSHDEAIATAIAATSRAEKYLRRTSPVLAYAYHQQAVVEGRIGRFDAARLSFQKAVEIDSTGQARGLVDQLGTRISLAEMEYRSGHYSASAKIALAALDYAKSNLGEMEDTLTPLRIRAVIATERSGDAKEAAVLAERLLADELSSKDSFRVGRGWFVKGVVAMAQGQFDEAERAFAAAAPGLAANPAWDDALRVQLATRQLLVGDASRAAGIVLPVLERARSQGRTNATDYFRAAERAGVSMARLGRWDLSRTHFEESCKWRRNTLSVNHPDRVRCESYCLLMDWDSNPEEARRQLLLQLNLLTADSDNPTTLARSLVDAIAWLDKSVGTTTRNSDFPLLN